MKHAQYFNHAIHDTVDEDVIWMHNKLSCVWHSPYTPERWMMV